MYICKREKAIQQAGKTEPFTFTVVMTSFCTWWPGLLARFYKNCDADSKMDFVLDVILTSVELLIAQKETYANSL